MLRVVTRSSVLASARAPTIALRRSLATVAVCNEEDQFAAAKQSEAGAVVYFTASWCGPCRMISPVFEKLAEDKSASTFLKVDVDDMAEVAAAARVSAMPTFMFYKSGQLLDTIVGADINALQAGVAEHLS